MKLRWSLQALRDLAEVRAYIAKDNPSAAAKVVERIVSVVLKQLTVNSRIGRTGRVAGTRELIVAGTPFVVPYRITAEYIEIVRVYHASRVWPDSF